MQFQLGLRRRGISDQAVLRAMDAVPREMFVAPDLFYDAYADTALPIECGQTISQPFVVAYMTEQLQVHPDHRVLEIGAGSGYQAAILAHLAHDVVAVERYARLAGQARARLKRLGLPNVEILHADGMGDLSHLGLFDRIIVTAAADEVPASLKALLRPGGRLVAPVGPANGVQKLVCVSAREGGGFDEEDLIAVRFVPLLPGLAQHL